MKIRRYHAWLSNESIVPIMTLMLKYEQLLFAVRNIKLLFSQDTVRVSTLNMFELNMHI